MDPSILTTPGALSRLVHDAVRALVLSDRFACVAGRAAVRENAYRFGLYDRMGSHASSRDLAADLRAFIADDTLQGQPMTAFIASFVEPVPADEETFERILWNVLQQLNDVDDRPWTAEGSPDPDAADFSFSFGGTGFFVVGLHANASRFSRRFAWTTLVFNPHAQFDRLRSEGRYSRFRDVIRARDMALQGTVNPMLRDFGEQSEAKQYSGRAVGNNWKCPFHARARAGDKRKD
jgi:uncharacterized protein